MQTNTDAVERNARRSITDQIIIPSEDVEGVEEEEAKRVCGEAALRPSPSPTPIPSSPRPSFALTES